MSTNPNTVYVQVRGPSAGNGSNNNKTHRRGDSGIGSSSSGRSTRSGRDPDYPLTAQEIEEARNDTRALREALDAKAADIVYWKNKCHELDDQLTEVRKRCKLTEAALAGEQQSRELLLDNYEELRVKHEELRQRNIELVAQNNWFKEEMRRIPTLETTFAATSLRGGDHVAPAAASSSSSNNSKQRSPRRDKDHSSVSSSGSSGREREQQRRDRRDDARERREQDRENDKLKARFNPTRASGDYTPNPMSPGAVPPPQQQQPQPQQQQPYIERPGPSGAYIERMGPQHPRPAPMAMAMPMPMPSVQPPFDPAAVRYAPAPLQQPVAFTHMQNPAMASVVRTAPPPAPRQPQPREDGNYHAHPLPR